MIRTERYGEEPSQYIELWTGPDKPLGLVVLIHGGFWRPTFTLQLMWPLASELVRRGWAVANIEYRRVGQGGEWPGASNDISSALQHLKRTVVEHNPIPIITIGHSAGGHLALLNSELTDAVVALAPVTDLKSGEAEEIGENAIVEFMRGPSSQLREAYENASPLRKVPFGTPILVVHGDADERVPFAHALSLQETARAAGDDVKLMRLPGVTHRAVIDPVNAFWYKITDWMNLQLPSK